YLSDIHKKNYIQLCLYVKNIMLDCIFKFFCIISFMKTTAAIIKMDIKVKDIFYDDLNIFYIKII
ncbi:TPA: hypothetical protein JD363_19860, partial [Providencia stuartii]|nr:hypothetical protein [Providencia stuartii]